jgi:type I restriction-modification system DNA methylase subunit
MYFLRKSRAGMTLLGYLSLALRVDGDLVTRLRVAVADNDQVTLEEEVLRRLDDRARRLGLTEVFPARLAGYWPRASWPFLGKLVNLALEHGTGDVFEALIVAIGRGSRGTGEFATPRWISELIMSLADPVQGVVVDPACGFGTLLVGASKAATAPLTLVGQDINDAACDIARLRMLAHGQPADITHGDTLRTDLSTESARMGSEEADLVLADPPFGNRMLEWLRAGIARLGESGLGIFVLPAASMFSGGKEGEARRGLIRARAIRAVIALPSSLYPTITVPVTIWVVRKPPQEDRRSEQDGVLLVDASQLGSRNRGRTELTNADAAAIARCFHAWQEREALSADGGVRAAVTSTEALLASGGDLTPASWIEIRQMLPSSGWNVCSLPSKSYG